VAVYVPAENSKEDRMKTVRRWDVKNETGRGGRKKTDENMRKIRMWRE